MLKVRVRTDRAGEGKVFRSLMAGQGRAGQGKKRAGGKAGQTRI